MVTRGWNGYRNKSQHRKSTLEKKILSVDVKLCFGIGLGLSLICPLTSEDIKQHYLPTYIAFEHAW